MNEPDLRVLRDQIQKIVSRSPDLLKRPYEYYSDNPTFGHCYVASEAMYHITGNVLQPYYGKDVWNRTHWWVQDDDKIYDPTAAQYLTIGLFPPYKTAIRAGFLTKQPSKRARILIDRVNQYGKHRLSETPFWNRNYWGTRKGGRPVSADETPWIKRS